MALLSFTRSRPRGFDGYRFVRSYASVIDGRLCRVEIRQCPESKLMVQVTTPMPQRAAHSDDMAMA